MVEEGEDRERIRPKMLRDLDDGPPAVGDSRGRSDGDPAGREDAGRCWGDAEVLEPEPRRVGVADPRRGKAWGLRRWAEIEARRRVVEDMNVLWGGRGL